MKKLAFLLAGLTFTIAARAEEPKRILFVGDSHSVGTFGVDLEKDLRKDTGIELARYASCGSSVSSWFTGGVTTCGVGQSWPTPKGQRSMTISPQKCPKAKPHCGPGGSDWIVPPQPTPLFEKLKVAEHVPDLTVIALGTNSARASDKANEAEIRRMITAQKKKGGRCVWVGPPDIRNCPVWGGKMTQNDIDRMYKVLDRVTSEPGLACHVVDSRKYTKYEIGAADCIHTYSATPKLAQAWASGVADEVREVLALSASDAPASAGSDSKPAD